MGAEYYMFAVFVVGLVALLAFLVVKGVQKNRGVQKEELEEREKKIMSLYFEVEDMIEALREYVDANKDRLRSEIGRLETDMQALQIMENAVRQEILMTPPVQEAQPRPREAQAERKVPIQRPRPKKEERKVPESRAGMRRVALEMEAKGYDIERIAREMHLSKGEVSFMLKLKTHNMPG